MNMINPEENIGLNGNIKIKDGTQIYQINKKNHKLVMQLPHQYHNLLLISNNNLNKFKNKFNKKFKNNLKKQNNLMIHLKIYLVHLHNNNNNKYNKYNNNLNNKCNNKFKNKKNNKVGLIQKFHNQNLKRK